MNQRLVHDCSVAMAQAILKLLGPAVPEEERRDAFDEFYCVCKAGIEAYEIQLNRMQRRLSPTKN
jgi:hypothetical protein